jgi:hypothetical protein
MSNEQQHGPFNPPALQMPAWRSMESPSYGPRVGEPQKTIEIRDPRGTSGTGGSQSGAFCNQYLNSAGVTMLLGGTITGAHGGAYSVPDYPLYAASDSLPLTKSGTKLYLKCKVSAILANGVMMPGLELKTASEDVKLTETLGTVHAFTTTALTGDLYIEVGRWINNGFLSSGACGLSSVGGCPGGYTIR